MLWKSAKTNIGRFEIFSARNLANNEQKHDIKQECFVCVFETFLEWNMF